MNEWQREIMSYVCRMPGGWTVTLLAQHMGQRRELIAARVDSLRRTGFLRRRVHSLYPTVAGRLAFELAA